MRPAQDQDQVQDQDQDQLASLGNSLPCLHCSGNRPTGHASSNNVGGIQKTVDGDTFPSVEIMQYVFFFFFSLAGLVSSWCHHMVCHHGIIAWYHHGVIDPVTRRGAAAHANRPCFDYGMPFPHILPVLICRECNLWIPPHGGGVNCIVLCPLRIVWNAVRPPEWRGEALSTHPHPPFYPHELNPSPFPPPLLLVGCPA